MEEIYKWNKCKDVKDFNLELKNTLLVLSADFSHFLPMQEAIVKENCAAHSLLHRKLDLPCFKCN